MQANSSCQRTIIPISEIVDTGSEILPEGICSWRMDKGSGAHQHGSDILSDPEAISFVLSA
jgi:hypothetical protein